MDRAKSLRVMAKYRNVIHIYRRDLHGRTALSLAAYRDHDKCARILVCCCFFSKKQKNNRKEIELNLKILISIKCLHFIKGKRF